MIPRPPAPPRPQRGRRRRPGPHAHGQVRASDRPHLPPAQPVAPAPHRPPAGTLAILALLVGFLGAVGLAHVHARTRVLEIGARISSLSDERARLLDIRRRLQAERAYLRHPDHVREVARARLGMAPPPPQRVIPLPPPKQVAP